MEEVNFLQFHMDVICGKTLKIYLHHAELRSITFFQEQVLYYLNITGICAC